MARDPMLHSMVAKDPRVAAMMQNPEMLMQNLKELQHGGLPSMPLPMPSEDGTDKSD